MKTKLAILQSPWRLNNFYLQFNVVGISQVSPAKCTGYHPHA